MGAGEEALANLLQFTVTVLPVAAVLLVALPKRPASTSRHVTLTAVIIQTVALTMGFIAWVATIGRASLWENVSWAVDIANAVAGLILTSAVLRSRGSEPLTRRQATTGKPQHGGAEFQAILGTGRAEG